MAGGNIQIDRLYITRGSGNWIDNETNATLDKIVGVLIGGNIFWLKPDDFTAGNLDDFKLSLNGLGVCFFKDKWWTSPNGEVKKATKIKERSCYLFNDPKSSYVQKTVMNKLSQRPSISPCLYRYDWTSDEIKQHLGLLEAI